MVFLVHLRTATGSCLYLFEACQTFRASFTDWTCLMMLFHSVECQGIIARVATVTTLALSKSTVLSLGLTSYCMVPAVSRVDCSYSGAIILTTCILFNDFIVVVSSEPRGHNLVVFGHKIRMWSFFLLLRSGHRSQLCRRFMIAYFCCQDSILKHCATSVSLENLTDFRPGHFKLIDLVLELSFHRFDLLFNLFDPAVQLGLQLISLDALGCRFQCFCLLGSVQFQRLDPFLKHLKLRKFDFILCLLFGSGPNILDSSLSGLVLSFLNLRCCITESHS